MNLQQANFEDLITTYYYGTSAKEAAEHLVGLITRDQSRLLATLLRDYRKKAISLQSEIKFREAVDDLMICCSAMELASLIGFIPKLQQTDFGNKMLLVLENKYVRIYYEDFYPTKLPGLFRSRLAGANHVIKQNKSTELYSNFMAFLALDRRFMDKLNNGYLLRMLDSFTIKGFRFNDVVDLLGQPTKFIELLLVAPVKRDVMSQILNEFSLLMQFCFDLRNILTLTESQPLFQSAIWNHYSYWFQIIGEELSEQLGEALQQFLKWKPKKDSKDTIALVHGYVLEARKVLEELTSTKFAGPIDCLLKESSATKFNSAKTNMMAPEHELVRKIKNRKSDQQFAEVCAKYADAVRMNPDNHETFYYWGIALRELARKKTGKEQASLFAEACAKYAEAVRIKPDTYEVFSSWGTVLGALARLKSGKEQDQLFTEASAMYAEAVRINPEMKEAFNNWGADLGTWAQMKAGIEQDILFTKACSKYAEAVRINPKMNEAFNNWGADLGFWAQMKVGKEQDLLFTKACAMYAEAVRIMPDMSEAFNNWGFHLSSWAHLKSGMEQDRLFTEACSKFAEAVRINPEMYVAFNNWGNALGAWAQVKADNEQDRLFTEAGVKYAEAVRIKPDMQVAVNNWSATLEVWSRLKKDNKQTSLLKSAQSQFELAKGYIKGNPL